jgi:hypothetical protein
MSNKTGIWIDSSKAVIVRLKDGKESVIELEGNIENSIYHDGEGDKGSFAGGQHMSQERKFEERKRQQIDKYLDDVIGAVKNDDAIFVFGPAEIKIKLKQKIEDDPMMKNKLQSVETADSMTQNQVVAKVKSFCGVPS